LIRPHIARVHDLPHVAHGSAFDNALISGRTTSDDEFAGARYKVIYEKLNYSVADVESVAIALSDYKRGRVLLSLMLRGISRLVHGAFGERLLARMSFRRGRPTACVFVPCFCRFRPGYTYDVPGAGSSRGGWAAARLPQVRAPGRPGVDAIGRCERAGAACGKGASARWDRQWRRATAERMSDDVDFGLGMRCGVPHLLLPLLILEGARVSENEYGGRDRRAKHRVLERLLRLYAICRDRSRCGARRRESMRQGVQRTTVTSAGDVELTADLDGLHSLPFSPTRRAGRLWIGWEECDAAAPAYPATTMMNSLVLHLARGPSSSPAELARARMRTRRRSGGSDTARLAAYSCGRRWGGARMPSLYQASAVWGGLGSTKDEERPACLLSSCVLDELECAGERAGPSALLSCAHDGRHVALPLPPFALYPHPWPLLLRWYSAWSSGLRVEVVAGGCENCADVPSIPEVASCANSRAQAPVSETREQSSHSSSNGPKAKPAGGGPFKLRFWHISPKTLEALGPDLWKRSINGASSGLWLMTHVCGRRAEFKLQKEGKREKREKRERLYETYCYYFQA
ncbi:hypothetical protein C8R44DRAFT_753985, partial [Mycena epipterygia]